MALTILLAAVACGGGLGAPLTSPQVSLSSVAISPKTATLAPGGQQQFTATGLYSDGAAVPIAATYSARGGTISPAGLYVAGDTAGDFWVVASLLNGSLRDSARVTVQSSAPPPPPPPPPPPGSNEPAGFTAISDRPFSAKVEAGWLDRDSPGDRFAIVRDDGAPKSAPWVGQATFPKGLVGGVGPVNTYLQTAAQAGRTEMYMQFWLKFSPNFLGAPSAGINKVLHIWTGQGSKAVFAAFGYNMDRLVPQMRMQNIDVGEVAFNLDPNVNRGVTLARNTWYRVEILLRLNTPGQRDGEIHWWVDGTKLGQYTNIGYNAVGKRHDWWNVQWNPTYGSPQDVVAADQYMWIDHFYVSVK